VQVARINANGTLGAWTATTSFTTARSSHTSVALGGYLYVVGGQFGPSATKLQDVQAATINANGTLGAWTATTSLPTVLAGHTSVAYNGNVYVIGGSAGTNNVNNVVQLAPI